MAEFKCHRCGHEWTARVAKDAKPKACPRCKSYFWPEEIKRKQSGIRT